MAREPAVYILASGRRGYIYVGVTSDIARRLDQHREGKTDSFVERRNCKRLVRLEFYGTMDEAITREKQLKNWHRDWKINLVEENNPDWINLAPEMGLADLLS
ncbi:GIY-YIG nuclease family protein [Erythrobacter sp. HA6-11]